MLLILGSAEYWLVIAIVILLGILSFVIRKNITRKIDPRILTGFGLSVVVFGTGIYLVIGIGLFAMDEHTTICLFSQLESDSLNKTKLLECYTNTIDTKWQLFMFSIIMSTVIVFGNIIIVISQTGKSRFNG